MNLYETIAEYYTELFPLKTERVELVASYLKGEKQKILDVGCATGQLALALAEKGHDVTGIDLDERMIFDAQQSAAATQTNIQFLRKNMTHIANDFEPETFDMISCFGNTLVHLYNTDIITMFFESVHTVLKPKGTFLVQIVNFDRVMEEEVTELPLRETDHFIFRRIYQYEANKDRINFSTTFTFKENHESTKSSHYLYPLKVSELEQAFRDSGKWELTLLSDESKAPWHPGCTGLIAVAQKQ